MSSPATVSIEDIDALTLHDRLLSIHGGAAGLRDLTLLQSALGRPQNLSNYDEQADLINLAAAYTAGIVKNHPFIDGNKRTGFVVGVLFLELNGFQFTAPEKEAAEAVLALAAGTLHETGYAAFLRENSIRSYQE